MMYVCVCCSCRNLSRHCYVVTTSFARYLQTCVRWQKTATRCRLSTWHRPVSWWSRFKYYRANSSKSVSKIIIWIFFWPFPVHFQLHLVRCHLLIWQLHFAINWLCRPVWARGSPYIPLNPLLPHLLLYLVVSLTFPLFPFLLTSSLFLLLHPFSFLPILPE